MIKSISFPNMFSGTYTNTCEDKEATKQNVRLTILSEQGTLFGDPEYGTPLQRYTFEQNDFVLNDLLKDAINTSIAIFMPQLVTSIDDILIEQKAGTADIFVKCINQEDFTTDLYNVASFDR